jgi:hypothetical protein
VLAGCGKNAAFRAHDVPERILAAVACNALGARRLVRHAVAR